MEHDTYGNAYDVSKRIRRAGNGFLDSWLEGAVDGYSFPPPRASERLSGDRFKEADKDEREITIIL